MPLDYAAIGGRLQARRKELGITQEDAAERVGITVVYLSKIENGRVHPTLDLLDRLCCVLEYDLARAFTGVQTTSPDYGQEQVLRLFNARAPRVKPVVLHLLEQPGNLNVSRSGKSMHHVSSQQRPGGIFAGAPLWFFPSLCRIPSIPCGVAARDQPPHTGGGRC
ncbi:MAG: helix-turn-helix domain-containing protein [Dysosmobacter welbionis]